MKALLLIVLIAGCNPNNFDSLNEQSKQFCKCHKGMESLQVSDIDYLLVCKDGTRLGGLTKSAKIYSECK